VSVRIYVEGGGDGISKSNCRKAFRLFFEKIVPSGSFQVIASGDRRKTFDDFCTARTQHPNDYVILLVDSEEPIVAGPWEHLAAREGDGWQRPNGTENDHAQLMVQVMESWFLADHGALAQYYGQGFHRGSLPRNANLEQVSKVDVFKALENATKKTKKGEYHKTRHGFDLVERIDPALVRAASGHAERLLTVLTRETATG
jgi:Domain of unknown function (DUF4276)